MDEHQHNELSENTRMIKQLLVKMKQDCESLIPFFWSPKEGPDGKNSVEEFRVRMKVWAETINHNLDWYQAEGWKKMK
ncbi:hypothetical protein KZ483_18460 [Paenibacillus sp. sptzw28]|uniref:hypothetical protein n=1 Tax=Paenibacillus sp. sptzw28 TaxID=715179 RepID=UPI001C6E398D|nr:hypothetical protein [Paenibacillus sp. sptzw28]QYR19849.1 hypothetical protein KZ483_18460 [Paenibacillus sp. sptzw28]